MLSWLPAQRIFSVTAKERESSQQVPFASHLFSIALITSLFTIASQPIRSTKYQFLLHITRGPCAFPQGVSAVLFHCCLGLIFSPVPNFPQSTRFPSITIIVTCNYHHHLLPQFTQFVSLSSSPTTLSFTTHHHSKFPHSHWHPDNNRLSAVALLRAWDLL